MARETADAEPDGEDGKTQESGTRKAGDANKNTAKVTVGWGEKNWEYNA